MSRTQRLIAASASLALVFTAASGTALDISLIEIETATGEGPGGKVEFTFVVMGDMLTDVTVTPPGATPIDLVFDPLDEDGPGFIKRFEFSSVTDLQAEFPNGLGAEYLFEFNGGTTSTTLLYSIPQPNGFATITYPVDGGTASADPTFSWTICETCSATTTGGLFLYNETAMQEVFDEEFDPSNPADRSLVLSDVEPPLTVGDEYDFSVDLVNGAVQFPSINADSFEYFASFRNDNGSQFTVVPEPSTSLLVGTALMTTALLDRVLRKSHVLNARGG